MAVCHGDKHSGIKYWYSGEKVLHFTIGWCDYLYGWGYCRAIMENNTVLVQILHLLCPCQRKPNTKYQINFVPNVGIFTVSFWKLKLDLCNSNLFWYKLSWLDMQEVKSSLTGIIYSWWLFCSLGMTLSKLAKIVRILKCLPHSMYW